MQEVEAATALDEAHYRDSLSNVNKEGKRLWIFPRKPKGGLYLYRTLFAWFLYALFFVSPFIKMHGHPMLLFNILERKFIIFGMPFWPQDLNLFALLMLTFILFIIVFTVLFGRVWCGWACPQTIFMEMLFRKVEYLIEGDFNQQKKLAAQTWTTNKIVRKTAKHVVFYLLSFLIANTFLSYIIGIDEMKLLIIEGPIAHLGKLISLLIFSTVFYFVFAFLREIVCVIICPYGRLQGLMLDQHSIVVAYNYLRGEPRGKSIKKQVDTTLKGDCIDCKLCVQVCPTGIDIRNGTQLECINCTACIDACDEVMVKINKPKRLIGFNSKNGIDKNETFKFTLRNVGYSSVLLVLFGLLIYLVASRKEIETTLNRTAGMLYQTQTNGNISNLYNIEVVNKTFNAVPIELELIKPIGGKIILIDRNKINIPKDELAKTSFFIEIDPKLISSNQNEVLINVKINGEIIEQMKSNFLAPVN
ncbi:MAG: cytochrome c oxidase accessory protein CcoG [Bacteroidota bacterium]